jgi:ADP-heptose:LPS heptosyltransferase
VTGSPAERALVHGVADGIGQGAINLVERGMDLGALKAVLARADLLITNDTGPRHIAAAVGTPVVGLFGPTDHRWTILPGVVERRLLAEPFLPEELAADDRPTMCAIERIPVEDVVAAAKAVLDLGRAAP